MKIDQMTRDELIAKSLALVFPERGRRPKRESVVERRLRRMTLDELRDRVARQRYSAELYARSEPANDDSGLRGRFGGAS